MPTLTIDDQTSLSLSLTPLAAILVSISRVTDFRHSALDVTWGAIIGMVFAVYAYLQYYPPLTAANCEVPYPPRDFSYLARDTQVDIHDQEPGQLESAIGIRPNDHFVDESQTQALAQENTTGAYGYQDKSVE